MMEIRLNKLISDTGRFSRREADRVIESGRVFVNGKRADVGMKVTSRDKIVVDGERIEGVAERVYIALNKPAGIVCTTDSTEPDNVADFVNYPTRVFNVGRLDKDSEGLLFMTNDGDIVNKILRAANNHEKEYVVQVNRPITPEFIERMGAGVPILGTMTKKCKVTQEAPNRFRIVLTQGLNRQIRRMCEALDYEVTKLCRVRIMNITLDKLPLGQWRFFTDKEIAEVNRLIADSESSEKASKGAGAGTAKKKPSASARPSQGSSTKRPSRSSSPQRERRGSSARPSASGRREAPKGGRSSSKGRRGGSR